MVLTGVTVVVPDVGLPTPVLKLVPVHDVEFVADQISFAGRREIISFGLLVKVIVGITYTVTLALELPAQPVQLRVYVF